MRWRCRAGWPLAALAVVFAALLLAGGPARAHSPTLGAFVGVPPPGGSLGLLVTTESASGDAFAQTVREVGCDPESISVWFGRAVAAYIPGAPPLVNSRFPGTIPADTPVVVRCRADITPEIDPPNARYVIDGDTVTLVDGRSDVPVAPGSATSTITTLSARHSYGDLDGDGDVDAAVALVQNPGGSGTFHYLAVHEGGSTSPAPTVFLGDRVVVERVAIAHGRVTVSYLTRTVDEAFVAPPTVAVTRHFTLEGGELVEIGSGVCEASGLDTVGPFVFVTTVVSGTQVFSGFTMTGCSRTATGSLAWRLLDDAGVEIASGFTTGGGTDGPGRFTFTVDYDVSERQRGQLEVFGTDASVGEGYPPPSDAIALILR